MNRAVCHPPSVFAFVSRTSLTDSASSACRSYPSRLPPLPRSTSTSAEHGKKPSRPLSTPAVVGNNTTPFREQRFVHTHIGGPGRALTTTRRHYVSVSTAADRGHASIDALADKLRSRRLEEKEDPLRGILDDHGVDLDADGVTEFDSELLLYQASSENDAGLLRTNDPAKDHGGAPDAADEESGTVVFSPDHGGDGYLQRNLKKTPAELAREVHQSIDLLSNEFEARVEEFQSVGLTPAQQFLMENKDRLLQRAQEYYIDRQQRGIGSEVEEEWAYQRDPVVIPPKGHLWSMRDDARNDFQDEAGGLAAQKISTEDFVKGVLPGVSQIVTLLEQEECVNIRVFDMDECGRRDIGQWCIIATCQTSHHNNRVGRMLMRTVRALEVPHITCYSISRRIDEWVHAALGPIQVQLFTPAAREDYRLDDLYEDPDKFFQPGDFPHFPLDNWGFAARTSLGQHDDRVHDRYLGEYADDTVIPVG